MIRRYFVLGALFLGLSGCANLYKPDISDMQLPPKGEGILVTNVVTNLGDISITMIDKKNVTIASASFDLKAGENFRVISLPAGSYSWRGIYAHNRASEFRDKMDFTILPGQINYIGDLHIQIEPGTWNYKIKVVDNADAAEQRIKENFPKSYKSLPFTKSLTIDKRGLQ